MKQVRRVILTLCVLFGVTLPACTKSNPTPSAAARLVQTELRREFNTRHLDVWEKSGDTLLIALTGGRLLQGPSGKYVFSPRSQGAIARRAIEILTPDSLDRSRGVTTVIVDVTGSSRFGPIVYNRKQYRQAYRVDSMFRARKPPNWMARARATAVVQLELPADSVR